MALVALVALFIVAWAIGLKADTAVREGRRWGRAWILLWLFVYLVLGLIGMSPTWLWWILAAAMVLSYLGARTHMNPTEETR